MKRILLLVTAALVRVLMMAVAGPASATLHPVVESFDCAYENNGRYTSDWRHRLTARTDDPQGPEGKNDHAALKRYGRPLESVMVGHSLDGQCGTGRPVTLGKGKGDRAGF
jgi:hypothetical protein